MKNRRMRNFLLAFLFVASFSSFMYVNLAVDANYDHAVLEQTEKYEIEDEKTVLLPDLELLEGVINHGLRHFCSIAKF